MNRKEVTEIRKNLFADSPTLVMNRILTVIVNPNHDSEKIRYQNICSGVTVDAGEQGIYYRTLRKLLNNKVGKKFIEYHFPNDAYGKGNAQNILYNVTQSAFKNSEDTENYVNHIVSNLRFESPYAIISAHCTYNVFKKNKMDETDAYAQENYNFILTAICPIEARECEFAYNFSSDEFINSIDTKLFIDKVPSDGFMFPAFNDRSSDVNSVMYYTKSPKEINVSIVESVLGCNFIMTLEQELAYYKLLLAKVADMQLSYELIFAMNAEIEEYIENNRKSTEVPVIDRILLKQMFSNVFLHLGISVERLESFDAMYNNIIGEGVALTATNLVNAKMQLECCGISLNVKEAAADSVCVSPDGHTITINVKESGLVINGIKVR